MFIMCFFHSPTVSSTFFVSYENTNHLSKPATTRELVLTWLNGTLSWLCFNPCLPGQRVYVPGCPSIHTSDHLSLPCERDRSRTHWGTSCHLDLRTTNLVKGQSPSDLKSAFWACEHVIVRTPQENPFKFGTTVHLDSRINWLDSGDKMLHGISSLPLGNLSSNVEINEINWFDSRGQR